MVPTLQGSRQLRSATLFTGLILCFSSLSFSHLSAEEVEITILHTNDLHQHLEPLPGIAGYVADYKKQNPHTVFTDAGDWFDRGSSLVTMTRGEALYGAMAAMGYDMWILGNHDWAYGGQRLLDLIHRYPVPVLSTNLGTTLPELPSNLVRTHIVEFDGVRVGFFGITLDTYGKSPESRPELYVLDCREETARAVEELKTAGVDLIVAVTHLGFEKMAHEKGRSTHPSDQDLVKEWPDIDIVIGGHSHTLLKEEKIREVYDQTGAIITQAGASAAYVGRLTFVYDDESKRISRWEVEAVPSSADLPEHPKVAAFIDQQFAEHMPKAKSEVGEFKLPMPFHTLAAWYADFLRRHANADLSLMPRDTLYDEREHLPAGQLDVERLSGYLYDRFIVKATVSGAELLRYCEDESRRDRFNPFHHQGRPFSGDALFFAGFDASFDESTEAVQFTIDPERSYQIAIPWPYTGQDIRRYGYDLPDRNSINLEESVPGLLLTDPELLEFTTREKLVEVGTSDGLNFTRLKSRPASDWGKWTEHFEARMKK